MSHTHVRTLGCVCAIRMCKQKAAPFARVAYAVTCREGTARSLADRSHLLEDRILDAESAAGSVAAVRGLPVGLEEQRAGLNLARVVGL